MEKGKSSHKESISLEPFQAYYFKDSIPDGAEEYVFEVTSKEKPVLVQFIKEYRFNDLEEFDAFVQNSKKSRLQELTSVSKKGSQTLKFTISGPIVFYRLVNHSH